MLAATRVSKVADFVQKTIVTGLVTLTALGLVGAYQASSARIGLARRVKEQIKAREQELIAQNNQQQP